MSVEQIVTTKEFDRKLSIECERKFLPIFPESLEQFRAESMPIEQFYLSHPGEPFSLRMRETLRDGELTYEATLKDNGHLTDAGVSRIEVNASISAELYRRYQSSDTPILKKLRAEPIDGIVIDFFEDGTTQVESESEMAWEQFTERYGNNFVEITQDSMSRNEWRAHLSFRREHEGKEALVPVPELSPTDIVADILNHSPTECPIVVHIGGRSGSGKSTIVREVVATLNEYGISSNVMSTDDYHRGTTWLERYNHGARWEHWDDPVVYDTGAMANDLANLRSGMSIYRRSIDWTIVEPTYDGVIEPRDVLIVEGIYATSPDITPAHDLSYRMTTPLATCVGRRLLRDMRERPEFADPEKSLAYMLTDAEPAYRLQHDGEWS